MSNVDFYVSLGYASELLAQSEYHGHARLGRYLEAEILPALQRTQARFYCNDHGIPIALATWAWLSEEVEGEVHTTGRVLREDEWNCGTRLFFNDFIAPYGNLREVIRDLTGTVFPEHCATSLRRHADGSIRRVNRWVGVNYRVRRKASNGMTREAERKQAALSEKASSDAPGCMYGRVS